MRRPVVPGGSAEALLEALPLLTPGRRVSSFSVACEIVNVRLDTARASSKVSPMSNAIQTRAEMNTTIATTLSGRPGHDPAVWEALENMVAANVEPLVAVAPKSARVALTQEEAVALPEGARVAFLSSGKAYVKHNDGNRPGQFYFQSERNGERFGRAHAFREGRFGRIA